jgi:hypothetical protein
LVITFFPFFGQYCTEVELSSLSLLGRSCNHLSHTNQPFGFFIFQIGFHSFAQGSPLTEVLLVISSVTGITSIPHHTQLAYHFLARDLGRRERRLTLWNPTGETSGSYIAKEALSVDADRVHRH